MALLACLASGCATPAVLERARPSTETETRDVTIGAVKRAERLESGALLLCLEIRDFSKRQRSLEIPLQEIGELKERSGLDFGRDRGFDGPSPEDPTSIRYVFFQEDLEQGCPESETRPLSIYTTERSGGSAGPGVYTTRGGADGLKVRYRNDKPLWRSLRDVEISPVLRSVDRETTVPGKPAYYLALPFAVAFDVFIASFYFAGLLF